MLRFSLLVMILAVPMMPVTPAAAPAAADCALLARLASVAPAGFGGSVAAEAEAAGFSAVSIARDASGGRVWRGTLAGFEAGARAVDRRLAIFEAAIPACLPGARLIERGELDGLAWRVFSLPDGTRLDLMRDRGTPALPAHAAFLAVSAPPVLARR